MGAQQARQLALRSIITLATTTMPTWAETGATEKYIQIPVKTRQLTQSPSPTTSLSQMLQFLAAVERRTPLPYGFQFPTWRSEALDKKMFSILPKHLAGVPMARTVHVIVPSASY